MKQENKVVKDHWRFYTLSAVAYSCLEDIQEDESQFSRFLHFAMEGYRDFHIDQSHELHAEEIEMKGWNQIDFPTRMIDWVKLGFKDGNLIRVLTREHHGNVPKTFDIVGGVPQPNLPPTDLFPGVVDNSALPFLGFGNFFGADHYYGYSAGYNYLGYFDVDMQNRVFNFKDTISKYTKIYLEYVTDGINYNGQTMVNPLAFKLLKLYVHWMRKENDDRYSLGEKDRAQRLYNQEMMRVAERMLNLSIDTIREILRSGYTLVPQN